MRALFNLFFFISISLVHLAAQTSLHLDDLTRFLVHTHQDEIIVINGLQANETIDLSVIEVDSRQSLQIKALKNSFDIKAYSNGLTTLSPKTDQIIFKVLYPSKSQFANKVSLQITGIKKEANKRLLGSITTEQGDTPETLVKDVFIGGNCFDVTGVSAPGGELAYGTFSNGTDVISIEDGIVLASGGIQIAHGPNTITSAGSSVGSSGVDPDLADLVNTNALFDVAVIEFDFIPTEDYVSFEYVFASEEYCDYVNTIFNDVFGFFISGPGISGPFTNNAANIAVIPTTTEYVSINTVNWGSYSSFYVDNVPIGQAQQNSGCDPAELLNPPFSVDGTQLDGFTTVFTAEADLVPCETYHIKLAIADVNDGLFDSAVFLKANSFNAGGGSSVEVGYPDATATFAYEGCDNAFFYFERADPDVSLPLTINFNILSSSTATAGIDYEKLPDSFTIPAGLIGDTLWITIFDDLIIEGVETIELELDNTCSCLNPIVTVQIVEPPPIEAELPDFEFCTPQAITLDPMASGGIPNLEYLWDNGSTNPTLLEGPLETTTYTLTITDYCDNELVLSSTVTILEQIEATISGEAYYCTGGDYIGQIWVTFTGPGPWNLIYEINGEGQSIFGIEDNPFELPITEGGTYTLLSVNAGDCFGPGIGEIFIPEIILESENAVINPSCFGSENGSIDLMVNGTDSIFIYAWDNNSDEEDQSDLAEGMYTVTIEDQSGCAITDSVELVAPLPLNALLDSLQGTSCADSMAGLIWIEMEGGTAPYSFAWNDSTFTTEDINDLEAGYYSVAVQDSLGCLDTFLFDVPFLSPDVQIDIGDVDTLNCEVNSATIQGYVNDTTSVYAFSWTTDDGSIISNPDSSLILVDKGGTYILTVFDLTFGCEFQNEVELIATNYPPQPQVILPELLNCLIDTITLDGSLTTPDSLLYEWTTVNGSIITDIDSAIIEVTSEGMYQLVVTDTVTGCTSTLNIEVLEDINSPMALAGADMTIPCDFISTNLNGSGSSLSDSLQFSWASDVNGNILNGADTPNPEVNASGQYYLTITDLVNGCISIDSVLLSDPIPPEVNIDPTSILNCIDTIQQISGSNVGGSGNLLFDWTSSDGNILSDPNNNNIDVNQSGTYILEILDENTNCMDTDSIFIDSDYTLPNIGLETPDILTCSVFSTELIAALQDSVSEYSILWSTIEGNIIGNDADYLTLADAPGIYYFTIQDDINGCITVDSLEVFVDPNTPVSIAGPDQTINCAVNLVQLDGSSSSSNGNIEFLWETIDGNIISGNGTNQISVDAAGSYTLIVFDTIQNCFDTSYVEVFIDTISPVIDLVTAGLINCYNPSISINNIIENTSGYNFNWQWNGQDYSSTTSDSIVISNGGIYALFLLNGDNQCSDYQEITVGEDFDTPGLLASQPQLLNCLNDTELITATVTGSTNTSYSWSTNDGNILNDYGNEIEIGSAGTYELSITNLDNGCTNQISITALEDFEIPQISVESQDTIDCLHATAFIEMDYSSSNSNVTLSWSTSNGNIIDQSNPQIIEVDAGGSYIVQIVDEINGCINEASINIIEIDDSPNAFVSEVIDPGCDGSSGSIEILEVIGGTGPYEYSINGSDFSSDLDFEGLNPGNYTIEVKDDLGCIYEESFDLPELPAVDADLESNVTLILGETYELLLQTNLNPDEIQEIVWSPDSLLSCNNCFNPQIIALNNVTIQAIVYDIYGCFDIVEIQIRVIKDAKVYIPNIFSPNNDGVNDFVTVFAKIEQIQNVSYFAIYDRWGNRVFENENFAPNDLNSGWDGTFLNRKASLGVYAYVAIVELINGETVKLSGDVTLIR